MLSLARIVIIALESLFLMGRGDKKTRKGKITLGSYGTTRRRSSIKAKIKRAESRRVAESASTIAETPAKARKATRKKSES